MPESESRPGFYSEADAAALVKAGRVREIARLGEDDKEERIAEMMDGYEVGESQHASASDVASGMIEEGKTLVKPPEPTFQNADHLEANLNTLILNSAAARAVNRPQHLQDPELERQRRIDEQVVAIVKEEPSPEVEELDPMEDDPEFDRYTDDRGVDWLLKDDGTSEEQFQSDPDEEPPPEDQWPNYVSNNEFFIDTTTEDYRDAA